MAEIIWFDVIWFLAVMATCFCFHTFGKIERREKDGDR